MTTAAAVTDPPDAIPEFTSSSGRTRDDVDRLPFRFDGDLFVLRRPKLAIATQMLAISDDADGGRSLSALGIDLTRLITSFIGYIEAQAPEPALIEVPAGDATDYTAWPMRQLRDTIADRNREREPDEKITPAGGRKDDLAAALAADDRVNAPVQLADNPDAGKLRGQALIWQRLGDPDDGLDLPDLQPVFAHLMRAMFNRPTQARPASSGGSRDAHSRG